MKKYVKPELFFERYELSQHIADCALEFVVDGTRTHSDPLVCEAISDDSFFAGAGIVVFTSAVSDCATKYEAYCATNGGSGMNTFAS